MRLISVSFVVGITHFGSRVMMSSTVRSKNSACHFSIARLMSPSVMSPTTFPSCSETPSPNLPLLTWIIASPRCMSCGITGSSSVLMTSCAVVRSCLPSSPPGWNCAKSRGLKCFSCISAIASASPITSCAVVLLVGARFSGQASFFTLVLICIVEYLASSDCGLPLIPIMGMFMWSTIGMNLSSSSVCPLLLIASTTSSEVITPRSP